MSIRSTVTQLLSCVKRPFTGGAKGSGALSRAYNWLASVKTTVYLLSALALSYVVGTIFPQGESIHDYITAGGAFQFFVLNFELLDFFTSAFFLLLALLLLISLVICTYERLKILIKPRRLTCLALSA